MGKIRQYKLKGERVSVGLEDSKKTWKLTVRHEGIEIDKPSMPADYGGLRRYLRSHYPSCAVKVLYEAGFRGYWLRDLLVADGYECDVTPPHTITQERCSRQKNDRINANRLAKLLELNDYKRCWIPPRQLREDRQVSRVYEQIKSKAIRVSNQIRRAIEYFGLERCFPSGCWRQREYREAAEILKRLHMSGSLRFSIQMLFDELAQLRGMQRVVLSQLRRLAKSPEYEKMVKLLHSAPGIGRLTAIRLALELGDIGRFKSKEAFAAFLGLVPSDYSTGDNEHRGHITKQGNRYVRGWLIECAWVAIRHDPVLHEKYLRVARNGKGRLTNGKKAIVAVARKLAVRLRAILLSGEPYQVGLISCAQG